MLNEQEIALQRIKDPAYLRYEGTQEDVVFLQFLMKRLAKTDYGARIILGLKKKEELPQNHQLTLKIQDNVLVGLPSGAFGVHRGNGDIILFRKNNDKNDKTISSYVESLAHELCHEEQFQQGLTENSNFTPEQNFIINRLKELDALCIKYDKRDEYFIKSGFEGISPISLACSTATYNRQALRSALGELSQKDEKPDKSFEQIREILVKRIGVDIDPEYFSAQTLGNSPLGKKFFTNGELPIQQETFNMGHGKISVFRHPECTLRIYTPKEGKIRIEEEIDKFGGKSLSFEDQKSSETILAISQRGDDIVNIQTKQHPDSCKDLIDFNRIMSLMHLPNDVLNEFHYDVPKIEKFIISPRKTSEDLFLEGLARLRGISFATGKEKDTPNHTRQDVSSTTSIQAHKLSSLIK